MSCVTHALLLPSCVCPSIICTKQQQVMFLRIPLLCFAYHISCLLFPCGTCMTALQVMKGLQQSMAASGAWQQAMAGLGADTQTKLAQMYEIS